MRNSSLHLRNYHKTIHQSLPFSSVLSLPTQTQTQTQTLTLTLIETQRDAFINLLQQHHPKTLPHFPKPIHTLILTLGFRHDAFLSNLLLHSYKNSSHIVYARHMFDTMPHKTSVAWSSMVSMYAKHGKNKPALKTFAEFHRSSDGRPNEYTFPSVVRACAQSGAADEGAQVHCLAVKTGFDSEVFVGTSLVDFYVKTGDVEEARLVFEGLEVKSAVTWTIVIAGYAKSGKSEAALRLFYRMRETDVVPDKYVLSAVLTACSAVKFVGGGKQIHGYVLRRGTEIDVSVVNVLIDFYTKCGQVSAGRRLFDNVVDRDVISWTTMIAGYMQNAMHVDAVKVFSEMTGLGCKPDRYGCSSILTSCGSLAALKHGREVHAYTIRVDLVHENFVKNSLIDMYAKCDSLNDARKVFDSMTDHNVVSYNAMIEGYARQGKLTEAVDLFNLMRVRSVKPSILTFVSLLGVSAASLTLDLSKQVHGLTAKYGLALDIFAGSALIDVYSKCSCTREAKLVFEEMNEKDIVVWNAMFSGYAQQQESEEALKLYHELQLSGQTPNEFTFASVISAGSSLASIQHGQQFHSQIIKVGLENDPFVTNALVDMYSKCGSTEEAHKLFDSKTLKDVACWNSIISAYAHHGQAESALLMFQRMINDGIKPNYITFVAVLTACSHAGLTKDGLCHFESMPLFGIEPGIDHYSCIVSLLGRAGKLYEAKEFIEKMPMKPAAILWRSLLSACTAAGNVELGIYAAQMAILSDPMDSGSYIMLSNIYAAEGMWDDVKKVREKMEYNGVVKESGRSWV